MLTNLPFAWAEFPPSAEAAQRRSDFVRAYEQLCAARVASERARQRYERSVHHYSAALGLHREANLQLSQLKERFVEVIKHNLFTALSL